MQRIGILGGTFDPPHIGHLVLADSAIESLQLDRLLFVPAGDPPHKQNATRLTIEHRLAMLEHALDVDERFLLSRVDIDRPGPHYAADTVRIIQGQNPGAELFFVMGADSLRDLPTWKHPDLLIQGCKLAVMERATARISPDMHEAIIPGLAEQVVIIDAPLVEVSSTEMVDRLRAGKSVRFLVPDAVLDYIHSQQIYQD
jgi:nicotinate-nucleotide adenylyltransferase